ncbi:9892_t:CDS:2 [Dentiscutata erythropus]|uniref:9892_t:CDS:1 n=1 Tax=Dentiscutata erythropus TaxID=1348616 RepID=A0A9N9J043_9GLOM|nr:9892_t:CDS:2 [Dentiscutata erythropus]
MNLQLYQQLKTYLETAETPLDLSLPQQQRFKRQATCYLIQNDLLYYKNKKENGSPLRVIKENELEQQRLQAQHNIQEAQQKQKEHYDQDIRAVKFKIGDQVLLYESAKEKVYRDKLRENRKALTLFMIKAF